MSHPLWLVDLIKKFFPERFLFARLTNLPGIDRVVDFCLFHGDDIIYLPDDHTIHINEPITQPDDMLLPSQVVDHFIESANYHWIMDICICRGGNNCQGYPVDYYGVYAGY